MVSSGLLLTVHNKLLTASNDLLTNTMIQNAKNGGAYAILTNSGALPTYKAVDIQNIPGYAAEIAKIYPTKNPPLNYGDYLNEKLGKDKYIEVAPGTFLIRSDTLTPQLIQELKAKQGPIQIPIPPPPILKLK